MSRSSSEDDSDRSQRHRLLVPDLFPKTPMNCTAMRKTAMPAQSLSGLLSKDFFRTYKTFNFNFACPDILGTCVP
jgi:hypothetical protein